MKKVLRTCQICGQEVITNNAEYSSSDPELTEENKKREEASLQNWIEMGNKPSLWKRSDP